MTDYTTGMYDHACEDEGVFSEAIKKAEGWAQDMRNLKARTNIQAADEALDEAADAIEATIADFLEPARKRATEAADALHPQAIRAAE